MPELDLKPQNYRWTGTAKPRRQLSDRTFKWLMTIAGIWAATAIFFYRSFFPVEPGWWAYAAGMAPGALLWLYLAFTVEDQPPVR